MTEPSAWTPVLDGDDAQRAWRAIHTIADAVADLAEPSPDLALFWSYLSEAVDDDATAERTEAALGRFADAFSTGFASLDLHGGLAGAAWIAAHISDDVDDILDAVDRVLLERLAVEPWTADYDLMRGLAGFGVYFLARRAPSAALGLERVVAQLAATAVRTDHGATWHTRPDQLPEHQRVHNPDGYDNCGIAHGVPGVVSVLARIAERADAPAGTAALRDDAIRWVRAQHRDGYGFPCWVTPATWVDARTAWCYGDPGVTLALRDALVRARAPAHDVAAVDAMIDVWSQRTETGVVDAGVCHGSVGLAHLHNRLHHATGRAHHRELARTWYLRTLDMQRPGERIGGFPMRAGGADVALAQVLDGTCGVGLALLAAVTATPPAWDQLLLCDLASS